MISFSSLLAYSMQITEIKCESEISGNCYNSFNVSQTRDHTGSSTPLPISYYSFFIHEGRKPS